LELTNHMSHNDYIFKELGKAYMFKVTIGNGEHVAVEAKRLECVKTPLGT